MCSQTCVSIFVSLFIHLSVFFFVFFALKRNGWFGVLAFVFVHMSVTWFLCYYSFFWQVVFVVAVIFWIVLRFSFQYVSISLCFHINEKRNMSSLLAVPYCYSYALANIRLHMYNGLTVGVCARCILELSNELDFGVCVRFCLGKDWAI